ncbi:hypothetical protein DFJ74DRAFT_747873, partial [Hyaloraphidium curvatum]
GRAFPGLRRFSPSGRFPPHGAAGDDGIPPFLPPGIFIAPRALPPLRLLRLGPLVALPPGPRHAHGPRPAVRVLFRRLDLPADVPPRFPLRLRAREDLAAGRARGAGNRGAGGRVRGKGRGVVPRSPGAAQERHAVQRDVCQRDRERDGGGGGGVRGAVGRRTGTRSFDWRGPCRMDTLLTTCRTADTRKFPACFG